MQSSNSTNNNPFQQNVELSSHKMDLAASSMGNQSQRRKSPNKRMRNHKFQMNKNFGSNKMQTRLGGLVIEKVTCQRCIRGPTYKKGHHAQCPKSKNFGKSKSTIAFDASVAKNNEINNKPFAAKEKLRMITDKSDIIDFINGKYITPTTQTMKNTTAPAMHTDEHAKKPSPAPIIMNNTTADNPSSLPLLLPTTDNPSSLPLLSPQRIKQQLNSTFPNKDTIKFKYNVPWQVEVVMKMILESSIPKLNKGCNNIMEIDMESSTGQRYKNYKKLFAPGTSGFEIKKDDITTEPCPHYAVLEGVTIYIVHWELICPGIILKCPCCENGQMIRDRFNTTKNGVVTTIFSFYRPASYCISMVYKCNNCNISLNGNDGTLLNTLPAYAQYAYPVDAKFATGRSHLASDSSFLLNEIMCTYGNGEMASRLFLQARVKDYEKKMIGYYSRVHQQLNKYYSSSSIIQHMPSFDEYELGPKGPGYGFTGASLRDLYKNSERSALTLYGYSNHNRYVREMQCVGANLAFIVDHTFAVTKNYRGKKAKACFNIATETGEIASAILVENASTEQFSHAAESFSKRHNVIPKIVVSDTWPYGKEFWAALFPDIVGRLGLFHFLNRIYRTLREKHIDFIKAIRQLQLCCYDYNKEDEAKLYENLRNGNLAKLAPHEIEQLKDTKTWKIYTTKYLRKVMHPAQVIDQKLSEWFNNFKCSTTTGKFEIKNKMSFNLFHFLIYYFHFPPLQLIHHPEDAMILSQKNPYLQLIQKMPLIIADKM
jgi:hypothetical protein